MASAPRRCLCLCGARCLAPMELCNAITSGVEEKFRELLRCITGNLAKIGGLRKTSWIKRHLRSKAWVGIEYLLVSGERRSIPGRGQSACSEDPEVARETERRRIWLDTSHRGKAAKTKTGEECWGCFWQAQVKNFIFCLQDNKKMLKNFQ